MEFNVTYEGLSTFTLRGEMSMGSNLCATPKLRFFHQRASVGFYHKPCKSPGIQRLVEAAASSDDGFVGSLTVQWQEVELRCFQNDRDEKLVWLYSAAELSDNSDCAYNSPLLTKLTQIIGANKVLINPNNSLQKFAITKLFRILNIYTSEMSQKWIPKRTCVAFHFNSTLWSDIMLQQYFLFKIFDA